MSKYEITNTQFATFLNAKNISNNGLYSAGAYPLQALIYASSGNYNWGMHYNGSQWVPVAGFENHPAINVSWYGAMEFAVYAGGRLPTEAEWEYACRAGTITPFNTGNCLNYMQANYDWASPYSNCTMNSNTPPNTTQIVGTYPANTFGLNDMHGNVWEWCSDWYGTYPTSAQTDPTGAPTGWNHIIRGGSFYDNAHFCRSAFRYSHSPDDADSFLGFRIVLSPFKRKG
jgi:formylglycine-generating enzyme required for sulfatase activity